MSTPFDANFWVTGKDKYSNGAGWENNRSALSLTMSEPFIQDFNPANFVVPGWQGNSLPSKASLKLAKILDIIKEDAKSLFFKSRFNKSLERHVYYEFLKFAHDRNLDFSGIDTYQDLIFHLQSKESQYNSDLEFFQENYFTRVSVVYLLKIRLMIKLSESLGNKVSNKYLKNPSAFFVNIFKAGSSTEIDSSALKKNHYSWYHPSLDSDELNVEKFQEFSELSISEIYKVFKMQDFFSSDEGEKSYSLSNEAFGTFIIQLLTLVPEWLNTGKPLSNKISNILTSHETVFLNTLFCGDYLDSISLSHWLAQKKVNLKGKKYIIRPEFRDPKVNQASYMNLCFELIFLGLLTDIADRSERDVVELISKTYQSYSSQPPEADYQTSLFGNGSSDVFGNAVKGTKLYDRVVLNLCHFPKNNPHHYLLGKIHENSSLLSENGYLYVFSMQKLFIPSMSSKIEELLKKFRIDTVFTFEKLKGKGELPSYLYVLSKRSQREQKKLNLPSQFLKGVNSDDLNNLFQDSSFCDGSKANGPRKYPCFSFRFSGDLTVFGKFRTVTKGLKSFIRTKNHSTTPLFEQELDENLTFEFYQDAICKGRMINTTSRDKSRITHPAFFKKLMRSCLPLEHFFHLENLDSIEQKQDVFRSDLLGIKYSIEEQFPWILILDHRNKSTPQIEIIPSSHYKMKSEKYGKALCAYFGITPKIRGININQFKHFYQTEIGNQIIQIGINDGFKQLKAKVSAILVPRFFGEINELPLPLESNLNFFKQSSECIVKENIKDLNKQFDYTRTLIKNYIEKYPWQIYSHAIHLESTLLNSIQKSFNFKYAFQSPVVIENLGKLHTQKLYPNNSDIYLKFHVESTEELALPFTEVKTSKTKTGNHEIAGATILSNGKEICTIYSRESMIQFLKFILGNFEGYPVSQIIQNASVPYLTELDDILERYKSQSEELRKLYDRVKELSKALIKKNLSIF